jgi:hypothetical protein
MDAASKQSSEFFAATSPQRRGKLALRSVAHHEHK